MKRCPVTDTCPNQVYYGHVMCGPHWARVPKGIQNEVYYQKKRRPKSPAHLRTIKRAIMAAKQA